MTEKKTFKNPYHISHSSDWIEVHQLENTEIPSFIGHEDDWDMEVTFTKKVKPPKVGDKALSPSGISECEIAAIDGDEVWLRYSDGSHSTIDLDKLIYAS